jgi:HD-like signal output (HDOD) protein
MLNPEDFKLALQNIDALGATPAVLLKVVELTKDPNLDVETLGALLRNDGPLVADIIRISNSAYYAPAEVHSNLTSAISHLGLREVVRLINLSLARQLFARDLNSYGITAYDYWRDSVASALILEALAKPAGLNPEDAYTVGILHPIGRLLINRVIEEKGFSIFWDGSQTIEQWEHDAVGFDFVEAGAMLLEHWHFPAPTCDVVRWQLDPSRVEQPVSLLGALQFTRRFLKPAGLEAENQDWPFPENDGFVQASGLTREAATQLVSACREDFQRIRQAMDFKDQPVS